jgi:transcription elongation factor GreB
VSKAFTKESDASEPFIPPRAPLPPGTQNYITRAGAERIQKELADLLEQKRTLPGSEQGKIEGRIQYFQSLTSTFVIVEPSPSEVVRFGATVTLKRGTEVESYTIVGVDEIDLDQNRISWLSPLARALMSRRAGDRVPFQSPAGREQLEILKIA